jgi:hypothetical protein
LPNNQPLFKGTLVAIGAPCDTLICQCNKVQSALLSALVRRKAVIIPHILSFSKAYFREMFLCKQKAQNDSLKKYKDIL